MKTKKRTAPWCVRLKLPEKKFLQRKKNPPSDQLHRDLDTLQTILLLAQSHPDWTIGQTIAILERGEE